MLHFYIYVRISSCEQFIITEYLLLIHCNLVSQVIHCHRKELSLKIVTVSIVISTELMGPIPKMKGISDIFAVVAAAVALLVRNDGVGINSGLGG